MQRENVFQQDNKHAFYIGNRFLNSAHFTHLGCVESDSDFPTQKTTADMKFNSSSFKPLRQCWGIVGEFIQSYSVSGCIPVFILWKTTTMCVKWHYGGKISIEQRTEMWQQCEYRAAARS